MEIFEKEHKITQTILPLIALFAAFSLYGLVGLILLLAYMALAFIATLIYHSKKQPKTIHDNDDTEAWNKYEEEERFLEQTLHKIFVYAFYIPLSLIVIVYLYFEVEYGILFVLFYILFYTYKTQKNLETTYKMNKSRIHMLEHEKIKLSESVTFLEDKVGGLEKSLEKLYLLNGFDREKLLELEGEEKRRTKLLRYIDSDLEHNWVEKLYQWADDAKVSEYQLTRNKDDLLKDLSYGQTTSLDLSTSNIDILPEEIGYMNIVLDLDLSLNYLTTLPENIKNIKEMEELNLKLNNFQDVPLQIGKLRNLRKLDMSSNDLTSIPENITTIMYLSEVFLHNNPIKALPLKMTNMKYIEKITIDKDTEIPTKVREFFGDKLEIIDIGWIQGLWDWADSYGLNKNIIPRNKTELLNLESLKLSVWDILSASPSNEDVNTINDIDFTSKISKLPKEIGHLIQLKELSISDTKIIKLPKEIGNLVNLEVLSLDNTNMTELPKEIGKLKKLKRLQMRNTQITSISSEIKNLENLKIFSIDRNS